MMTILAYVIYVPRKAGDADIRVACGKHEVMLFKNGKAVGKIPENQVEERLIQGIDAWEPEAEPVTNGAG